MQSKTQRRLAWLSIILSLGLVAAACGGDDDDSRRRRRRRRRGRRRARSTSPARRPSSPSPRWPPRRSRPRTATSKIAVDGPGTGDGFELFCQGETDISDASRAIDEEEAAACADAGIEYVELQDRLRRHGGDDQRRQRRGRVPQLRRPLRPHRPRVRGLRQLVARARRSPRRARAPTPSCPTPRSTLTGPGSESGTYDSFVELALGRRSPRSGARKRAPPGPTTPRRLTTTRSSPTSRPARPRWAGSASPTPKRPATPSRRSPWRPSPAATASSRAPRRSRTRATRCPARCSST